MSTRTGSSASVPTGRRRTCWQPTSRTTSTAATTRSPARRSSRNNVWHHAAATFNGTVWSLYLDGNLEASITPGFLPRSDSTQGVGLGAMITSAGTPTAGRFDGVLDEARVWNVAHDASQIAANMGLEISSGATLKARWGMNEAGGGTVGDSMPTPADGTITGSGTAWVAGAPVTPAAGNQQPNAPTAQRAHAWGHRDRSVADARRHRLRSGPRPDDGHVLGAAVGERHLRADRPEHRCRVGLEHDHDLVEPRARPVLRVVCDRRRRHAPRARARPGRSTPPRAPIRSSWAPATSPRARSPRTPTPATSWRASTARSGRPATTSTTTAWRASSRTATRPRRGAAPVSRAARAP